MDNESESLAAPDSGDAPPPHQGLSRMWRTDQKDNDATRAHLDQCWLARDEGFRSATPEAPPGAVIVGRAFCPAVRRQHPSAVREELRFR